MWNTVMRISKTYTMNYLMKHLPDTMKCVQLAEQGRKLTAKVDGQQKQISCLTDKVMEQSDTIDRLQEKASDLGRLERHFGREQVQSIVGSKALEQAEWSKKRPKRAFEMSR